MSFDDLQAAVAKSSGLSKVQVGQALTALIEHVQTSLGRGEKINLPGLGQFDLAARAACENGKPRTGAPITIAAGRAVEFKPSEALEDVING